MVKILQVNIGECRAAHDLLLVTAAQIGADIIILSKSNKARGKPIDGWYFDASGRSAIAIMGNLPIDTIGQPEIGFVWTKTSELQIYSCYYSPNVTLAEFENSLVRLERSIRSTANIVIVAGDFNSKSTDWGSANEHVRGKLFADLAASLGLVVCNQGHKPIFIRGASKSHIYLTLVSQQAAGRVSGWTILEEETLSLHRYIVYEINARRTQALIFARKGWAIRKIDNTRLVETLERGTPVEAMTAEEDCRRMMDWLTRICNTCMPKANYSGQHQPSPWWNSDITEQRRKCLKARRRYTRKGGQRTRTDAQPRRRHSVEKERH